MKKFELTSETCVKYGTKVYRIRALIDFGDVRAGHLGGFVESEDNLSHSGTAWIEGEAVVKERAIVKEDAVVRGRAVVDGNAVIAGTAWVDDDAAVRENALIEGDAWVNGNAIVKGDVAVGDDVTISNNAWVSGNAVVSGNATIDGEALVSSNRDYVSVLGIGPEDYLSSTFYKCKSGQVGVSCGWFEGTLDEFRTRVREKYRYTRLEKEYIALADCMEYKLSDDWDEV